MWLSFPEPHNPYQVPEPYFSMFPVEELPPVKVNIEGIGQKSYKWKWTKEFSRYVQPEYDRYIERARANYFGMLRLLDDQIKRFVEHLENKKLMENTIIIYVSDHGDFVGEYGLTKKGPEMPEVLMRIPMFAAGPGIKASNNPSDAFVSLVDIFPTVCDILKVKPAAGPSGFRTLCRYPAEG